MTQCVIVADPDRARIFHLAPADPLDDSATADMMEVANLVNPPTSLRGGQRASNPELAHERIASGRARRVQDTRREGHAEHVAREFVARVVDTLHAQITEQGCGRIVLVASARMLGHVRPSLEDPPFSAVAFVALEADLTTKTPKQIYKVLRRRNLHSERQPLRDVYAPRGQYRP